MNGESRSEQYSRVALSLMASRFGDVNGTRHTGERVCFALSFCLFGRGHQVWIKVIRNIGLMRFCLFWQLFSYLDLTSATKLF